jgi:CheY-like chemotaxis protein
VRAVLRQVFDTPGYACVLAADGREALEVFKARPAPLVVTDLKMPGMIGIELLRSGRSYAKVNPS